MYDHHQQQQQQQQDISIPGFINTSGQQQQHHHINTSPIPTPAVTNNNHHNNILSPDRANPSDPVSVLEFCEDVGPHFREWLEDQNNQKRHKKEIDRKFASEANTSNDSPIDKPIAQMNLLYCALCRKTACPQTQLDYYSPHNKAPHNRPFIQTPAELIDKLDARGFMMYDGVPHCFRCAKRLLKDVLYPHFKSAQGHGGALIMERIAEVDDLSVKQNGYVPALEKLNLVVAEASERSYSSSSVSPNQNNHYTDSLFESLAFQLFRYRPLGFLLRLIVAERALSEQAVYQGFVCPRQDHHHYDPSNPYQDLKYQRSENLRFLQFLDNMTEPNSDGSFAFEEEQDRLQRNGALHRQRVSSNSVRFVPMVLGIISSYFGVNVHLVDPSRAIDGRWHTMISAPPIPSSQNQQQQQQQNPHLHPDFNNNSSRIQYNKKLEEVPGEVYILAVNLTASDKNNQNNNNSSYLLMHDVSSVASAINNSVNHQPQDATSTATTPTTKRVYHSLVATPKDLADISIPYLKWLKATSMSNVISAKNGNNEDDEDDDNEENNNRRQLQQHQSLTHDQFSPISADSGQFSVPTSLQHHRSGGGLLISPPSSSSNRNIINDRTNSLSRRSLSNYRASSTPIIEQQNFVATAKTPKDDDDDGDDENDQNRTSSKKKKKNNKTNVAPYRSASSSSPATAATTRNQQQKQKHHHRFSPPSSSKTSQRLTPIDQQTEEAVAADEFDPSSNNNNNQSPSAAKARVLHVPSIDEDIKFLNFKTFSKNKDATVGFGSKIALEFFTPSSASTKMKRSSSSSSSSSPMASSLLGISSFLQPTLVSVTGRNANTTLENCMFEIRSVMSSTSSENPTTSSSSRSPLHNGQSFTLLHCQTGLWLTLSQDDTTDEFWLSFSASSEHDDDFHSSSSSTSKRIHNNNKNNETSIWRFSSPSSSNNTTTSASVDNFSRYQLESVPSASFPTPFVVMCSHSVVQQQQQQNHEASSNSINVYPKSRLDMTNSNAFSARVLSFSKNDETCDKIATITSTTNKIDTSSCEYFQIIYGDSHYLTIRDQQERISENGNEEDDIDDTTPLLFLSSKQTVFNSVEFNIESTFFKIERFPDEFVSRLRGGQRSNDSDHQQHYYYRLFSFDGREIVSHVKHINDIPMTSLSSHSSPSRKIGSLAGMRAQSPLSSPSSRSSSTSSRNNNSNTIAQQEYEEQQRIRKEKVAASQRRPKLVAIECNKTNNNDDNPVSPLSAWQFVEKKNKNNEGDEHHYFFLNKNELYHRDYFLSPLLNLSPTFQIEASFKLSPVSPSSTNTFSSSSSSTPPDLLQKFRKINSLATCSTQFVAAVSANRVSESMLRVLCRTLSSSLKECLSWFQQNTNSNQTPSSSTTVNIIMNYFIKNRIIFHLMRIIEELIPRERVAIVAAATKQQKQSAANRQRRTTNDDEEEQNENNDEEPEANKPENALDAANEKEELLSAFQTIAIALNRNPSIAFELVFLVFRCFEVLTEVFIQLRKSSSNYHHNDNDDNDINNIASRNNTVTTNLIYRVARFAIEYCPLVELKGLDFAMSVLRASSGSSFIFSPQEIQEIIGAVVESMRGSNGNNNNNNTDVDPALFGGYFKVLSSVIMTTSDDDKNDTMTRRTRRPLHGPQSLCGKMMFPSLSSRLFGLTLDRSQSVVVLIPENISSSHPVISGGEEDFYARRSSPEPENPHQNEEETTTINIPSRKMTMTLESLFAQAFPSLPSNIKSKHNNSNNNKKSSTSQQQQNTKYRLIMTAEERTASREQRAYFAAVIDSITSQLELFNDLCSSSAKDNILAIFSSSSSNLPPLVTKAVLEEIVFQTRSVSSLGNTNIETRVEQEALSKLRASALKLLLTVVAFAVESSSGSGDELLQQSTRNKNGFTLSALLSSPVIHLHPKQQQRPVMNRSTKNHQNQQQENEGEEMQEKEEDNEEDQNTIAIVAEVESWTELEKSFSLNEKELSRSQQEQLDLIHLMIEQFLVENNWSLLNPHPSSVNQTTIAVLESLNDQVVCNFTISDLGFHKKLISVIFYGRNGENEEEKENNKNKNKKESNQQQQYTRGKDFDTSTYQRCCSAALRLLSSIIDIVMIRYSTTNVLPLFASSGNINDPSSSSNQLILDDFFQILGFASNKNNKQMMMMLHDLTRLSIRLSPTSASPLAFSLLCKLRCFPLYVISFLSKNCLVDVTTFLTVAKNNSRFDSSSSATPIGQSHRALMMMMNRSNNNNNTSSQFMMNNNNTNQHSRNQQIMQIKRSFEQDFLMNELWRSNFDTCADDICHLILEVEPRGKRALKCVAESDEYNEADHRSFFSTILLTELFSTNARRQQPTGSSSTNSCDCEMILAAEAFVKKMTCHNNNSSLIKYSLEYIQFIRSLVQTHASIGQMMLLNSRQNGTTTSFLQYLLSTFVFGTSSSNSTVPALFSSSSFADPHNALRDELIPLLADIVISGTSSSPSSSSTTITMNSDILSVCDLFIGLLRAMWYDAVVVGAGSSLMISIQASLSALLSLLSSSSSSSAKLCKDYLYDQGLFPILTSILMTNNNNSQQQQQQQREPAHLRVKELCLLIFLEQVVQDDERIRSLISKNVDVSDLIMSVSSFSSFQEEQQQRKQLAPSPSRNDEGQPSSQEQQQHEEDNAQQEDFLKQEESRIIVLALNLMYNISSSTSSTTTTSSKCGLLSCPALKSDLALFLRSKHPYLNTVKLSSYSNTIICFEDEQQHDRYNKKNEITDEEQQNQLIVAERNQNIIDNFICSAPDSKEFANRCHEYLITKNDGSGLLDALEDHENETMRLFHSGGDEEGTRNSSSQIENYQMGFYVFASLIHLAINILLLIESDISHQQEAESEKIFVNYMMPSEYKFPLFGLSIALIFFELLGVIVTLIVVMSNYPDQNAKLKSSSSSIFFDSFIQVFTATTWLGFSILGFLHSASWYSLIFFRLVSLIPFCVSILDRPHVITTKTLLLSSLIRREHPFSTTASLNIARLIPIVFLATLSVAGVFFVFSSVVFFNYSPELQPTSSSESSSSSYICSSFAQCFGRSIYFGFNSNNNAEGNWGVFYPLLTNYSSFSSSSSSSNSYNYFFDGILYFWIFFESSISVIVVVIVTYYLATIIQRFVQVATLNEEIKKHFEKKERMLEKLLDYNSNKQNTSNMNPKNEDFKQKLKLCRYVTEKKEQYLDLTPAEREVWKNLNEKTIIF